LRWYFFFLSLLGTLPKGIFPFGANGKSPNRRLHYKIDWNKETGVPLEKKVKRFVYKRTKRGTVLPLSSRALFDDQITNSAGEFGSRPEIGVDTEPGKLLPVASGRLPCVHPFLECLPEVGLVDTFESGE